MPDTPPLVANERGGVQSDIPYRMDLLQHHAILRLAEITKGGAASHGINNWHKISTEEHLNHALAHIFLYLAGDTSEDHLGHASWRCASALDQKITGRFEDDRAI